MNTEEEAILRQHGETLASLKTEVSIRFEAAEKRFEGIGQELHATNIALDNIRDDLSGIKADLQIVGLKIDGLPTTPSNTISGKSVIAIISGIGTAIGAAMAALGKAVGWW